MSYMYSPGLMHVSIAELVRVAEVRLGHRGFVCADDERADDREEHSRASDLLRALKALR